MNFEYLCLCCSNWVINLQLINDSSAIGFSPLIFSPINQYLLTSVQVYCGRWALLWNQPEDFPIHVWFIKGLYNLSKFFPYYWQSSRWPSPADTSWYCCLAAASPMEVSRVSFLDQVQLECCNIRAKGSGLGSFAESGDLVVVREWGSFICLLQIHATPLLVCGNHVFLGG